MNVNKIIAILIAAATLLVFMPAAYYDVDLAHPIKGVLSFILTVFGFLATMYFWGRKTAQ